MLSAHWDEINLLYAGRKKNWGHLPGSGNNRNSQGFMEFRIRREIQLRPYSQIYFASEGGNMSSACVGIAAIKYAGWVLHGRGNGRVNYISLHFYKRNNCIP